MLQYLVPSQPVVSLTLNLDTLVYILLLTIFNPVLVWVLVYFERITLLSALLIDFLWFVRFLNYKYRSQTISKKVYLITGGSNGLGYELVKLLCPKKEVEKIIIIDQHGRTEFDKNEKIHYVKFDLNQDLSKLTISLDDVDALICNAGMRQYRSVKELSNEEIMKIINTNWISHLKLIKQIIKKKSNYHVMVIGSILGFVGPKNLGIYAGTKNALLSTMESLRTENKKGIFTMVLPGQLNSQMFADVQVNEFLAPVIDVQKLAKNLMYVIDNGMGGDFAYPLYGRLLPIYRILPYWLQMFCRWYSGMDDV